MSTEYATHHDQITTTFNAWHVATLDKLIDVKQEESNFLSTLCSIKHYLPRIRQKIQIRYELVKLTGVELVAHPDHMDTDDPPLVKRVLPLIEKEHDRLLKDLGALCAKAVQIAHNEGECKDAQKAKARKLHNDEESGGGNPGNEDKAREDRIIHDVIAKLKKVSDHPITLSSPPSLSSIITNYPYLLNYALMLSLTFAKSWAPEFLTHLPSITDNPRGFFKDWKFEGEETKGQERPSTQPLKEDQVQWSFAEWAEREEEERHGQKRRQEILQRQKDVWRSQFKLQFTPPEGWEKECKEVCQNIAKVVVLEIFLITGILRYENLDSWPEHLLTLPHLVARCWITSMISLEKLRLRRFLTMCHIGPNVHISDHLAVQLSSSARYLLYNKPNIQLVNSAWIDFRRRLAWRIHCLYQDEKEQKYPYDPDFDLKIPTDKYLSYPIHLRFSSEVPDVRSDQIQSTDPYRIHHDKLLHSYPVHITLNTAYFLHLVYPPFQYIGYAYFRLCFTDLFTCD
jgi:hypothetical protein